MSGASFEQEIRLLLERQAEAWNGGDAAGHAADLEDDCWFTNLLGHTPQGKAPFVARHERIFQSIFQGSRLRLEVLRLRRLSEDLAMVEARAVLSGFRALPPGVAACGDGALHTRLLQVLARREGAWRVVAYHNVDVKPGAENR
ncbi:MAG: SgcJ/EcaC family oxidoreductase [Acidobacteria bacterium]|nr:SgcJ/EcaC family oxidoreductase [Acidobacteriota bacterium]